MVSETHRTLLSSQKHVRHVSSCIVFFLSDPALHFSGGLLKTSQTSTELLPFPYLEEEFCSPHRPIVPWQPSFTYFHQWWIWPVMFTHRLLAESMDGLIREPRNWDETFSESAATTCQYFVWCDFCSEPAVYIYSSFFVLSSLSHPNCCGRRCAVKPSN